MEAPSDSELLAVCERIRAAKSVQMAMAQEMKDLKDLLEKVCQCFNLDSDCPANSTPRKERFSTIMTIDQRAGGTASSPRENLQNQSRCVMGEKLKIK